MIPPAWREVRLQDRGRPLLQHLAEAPLGEQALAGGDRDRGRVGDVGQHVDVLALHRLLDEEGVVRLERLDQPLGRLRADRAVEVDRDVDLRARPPRASRRRSPPPARCSPAVSISRPRRRRPTPVLMALKPSATASRTLCAALSGSRPPRRAVDPDLVARRAAEQLVDRQPQQLAVESQSACSMPERALVRISPAAVEGVLVHRLPEVDDPRRVLPDQPRLELLHRRLAGQRPPLQDRLAQADDALLGV